MGIALHGLTEGIAWRYNTDAIKMEITINSKILSLNKQSLGFLLRPNVQRLYT